MTSPRRIDVLTVTTAAGLAAAAGVHLAWARGSTWPRESADELADLVVGERPMPGPGPCAAVGVALGGAAVSVAVAGSSRTGGTLTRVAGLASMVTARALRTRGAGGLALAATGTSRPGRESTEEFRRMDATLYSPLCVALSLGAARAAKRAKAARQPV